MTPHNSRDAQFVPVQLHTPPVVWLVLVMTQVVVVSKTSPQNVKVSAAPLDLQDNLSIKTGGKVSVMTALTSRETRDMSVVTCCLLSLSPVLVCIADHENYKQRPAGH